MKRKLGQQPPRGTGYGGQGGGYGGGQGGGNGGGKAGELEMDPLPNWWCKSNIICVVPGAVGGSEDK